MRTIGTGAYGIRAPIIKEGDNLVDIVVQSVLQSGLELRDHDVIGVTEAVVARAQGNYVTTDDIAGDINELFSGKIGIVFPILSRNRFAIALKGIAKSGKKIYIQFSYPSDEVGNSLMDVDIMEEHNINPYSDCLSKEDYRRIFGEQVSHPFTGIDYVRLYEELSVYPGQIEVFFSNDLKDILRYTDEVLLANTHNSDKFAKKLLSLGAKKALTLKDVCKENRGAGYNPQYGLLGSNTAGEERLKLFPRDSLGTAKLIQEKIYNQTGKKVEVLIYGDGAFKDPIGKIWELADPVVSPGFTEGLRGRPDELKLKYLADNELADLHGEELNEAMRHIIAEKDHCADKHDSLGTTPRQLSDLLGTLCDLVSGSGDKGTPFVVVQGYFDNYASE